MQEIIGLSSIVLLLFFSFLYSGSEVSLLSISELDRLKLVRKKNSKNLLLHYLRYPQKALITILVGNMLVNVSASIIGEQLSSTFFIHNALFYSVFIMTFLVLLFGEIVPKNIAAIKPIPFSELFINVIHLTNRIFYPVIFLITGLVRKSSNFQKSLHLSKEELLSAIESSSSTGAQSISTNLLKNLLYLIDQPITNIMVPRSDIQGLDIDDHWDAMERFIRESSHSTVLFYKGNIDTIMGYVKKINLLHAKKKDIKTLFKKPFFVPESKQIVPLLSEFKEKKNYIAIVLDEYGGTVGLVTLRDILDSIFIKDILIKNFIQKKALGVWTVRGNTKIYDLNNTLHTELPVESNTIGGYIINMIGRIPEIGTELDIVKNYRVIILVSDSKQIELMEFTKVAR